MLFGAAVVVATRRARWTPQIERRRVSLFRLVIGEIFHAMRQWRQRGGGLFRKDRLA